MEILYSSAQVHTKIKEVLSSPKTGDRRVVLSAFIGKQAEAFLPSPKGLQIVCWLRPGSTDAAALFRLKKRGAQIFKSSNLHMKVYWSSRAGCVITSANASASALAKGGLKEAGIWLPAGAVDIDKFWKYAKPVAADGEDLLALAKHPPVPFVPGLGRENSEGYGLTFLEWMDLRNGQLNGADWKLCWWNEENHYFASEAVEMAKDRYGVSEPYDGVNVKHEQVQEGDWLLTFRTPGGQKIKWLYVDVIAPTNPTEESFDEDYPFEAVQAVAPELRPEPPFVIDRAFKAAFRKVLALYVEDIERSEKLAIPPGMLKSLAEEMRRQSLPS